MKTTLYALLFSSFSQAALVEFTGAPVRTLEVSGHKVPIYSEAVVRVGKSASPRKLKLTGAGVREKKILVVSANVYVLTSYTDSDPKVFAKNPSTTIQEGQTELLQMTLVRDLSADKIKDSFTDALEENQVPVDSKPIKALFSQLVGDQKEGNVISIVSVKGEKGEETLTFDASGKPFSVSGPRLGADVWKIWFGKPADSGLEDLQKELTDPTFSRINS